MEKAEALCLIKECKEFSKRVRASSKMRTVLLERGLSFALHDLAWIKKQLKTSAWYRTVQNALDNAPLAKLEGRVDTASRPAALEPSRHLQLLQDHASSKPVLICCRHAEDLVLQVKAGTHCLELAEKAVTAGAGGFQQQWVCLPVPTKKGMTPAEGFVLQHLETGQHVAGLSCV